MPEDTLSVYARIQPDKPGVIDDRPDGTVVVWTYAELEAQVNRVANLLLALGAGPGAKVLWCGPNSPQVVAVMNAARKIGEVAYVDYEHVPLFTALGGQLEKLRHVIAVGGPAGDTVGGPVLEGMLGDA